MAKRNFIQQTILEKNAFRAQIAAEHSALLELIIYMGSSKFCHGNELDNYININDVARYLDAAKIAGRNAFNEVMNSDKPHHQAA